MEETNDIAVLNLLLEATRREMMTWRIKEEDDEREVFSAEIAADVFEIELVNLQRAGEVTCERALARIQGRGIYETYSIGTKGYDLLLSMLRENIFGWKEGTEKAENKLKRLRTQLEQILTT